MTKAVGLLASSMNDRQDVDDSFADQNDRGTLLAADASVGTHVQSASERQSCTLDKRLHTELAFEEVWETFRRAAHFAPVVHGKLIDSSEAAPRPRGCS